MKQIAIIAPTASGKTKLSIKLAHRTNSIILSLDSLSIYKSIDISSAKPTIQEREQIVHFGIDEIYPNEFFDVMKFIELYKKAKNYCQKNNKNLIIVGGSSFYLKAMIDGISYVPPISQELKNTIDNSFKTTHLQDIYNYMFNIDKSYMKNIKSNDKYRIKKAYTLYKQTNQTPSQYFKDNPPKPIIKDIKLYQIDIQKDILKQRISLRTKGMLKDGLIDEVIYLEKRYSRKPNCMKSIGIKETLDYLDGKISKQQLEKLITIATWQLAKRQITFNKSQFKNINIITPNKIFYS